METYLQITYLNDFVFCPWSIYLHQVFDSNQEQLYSAKPQQRGKTAHVDIDSPDPPPLDFEEQLQGVYVLSNKFGVYGKIDTLYLQEKRLVESKYLIKTLYRGYYYQIWAQYFALTEMGYQVETLQFYSIKDCKTHPVPLPGRADAEELHAHIRKIAWFNFDRPFKVNPEKCRHCIYASLCDKTETDHVYA